MDDWRVVLDTNILVSAFQFGGKPHRIVNAALDGQFQSLLSPQMNVELMRILEKKFKMTQSMIHEVCEPYFASAIWIEPQSEINLSRDPDDNRILECAVEGKAQFVVTGDRDLLELNPVSLPGGQLGILMPEEFLALLLALRS